MGRGSIGGRLSALLNPEIRLALDVEPHEAQPTALHESDLSS
jgi:hypothetical protein